MQRGFFLFVCLKTFLITSMSMKKLIRSRNSLVAKFLESFSYLTCQILKDFRKTCVTALLSYRAARNEKGAQAEGVLSDHAAPFGKPRDVETCDCSGGL